MTFSNRLAELLEWVDDAPVPALADVVRAIALTYERASHLDVLGYEDDSWEDHFDRIRAAKAGLDTVEHDAVRLARIDGMSWSDIGECLGLSRAGAQRRHGRTELTELDALDDLHDAKVRTLIAETKLAISKVKDRGDEEASKAIVEDYMDRFMELSKEHADQRMEVLREAGFRY